MTDSRHPLGASLAGALDRLRTTFRWKVGHVDGWGMIPVRARIGSTEWTTSLIPKDGTYLVPVKDAVRRAEGLDEGDTVTLGLTHRASCDRSSAPSTTPSWTVRRTAHRGRCGAWPVIR